MKNKLLISLLTLSTLGHLYGGDSSTPKQNRTVTICKYSGASTGVLIGYIAGYILKKKMAFFVWNHSGLHPHKATDLQSAIAGAGDGLVEALCQYGSLFVGYTAGDKLGTKIGLWLTKNRS